MKATTKSALSRLRRLQNAIYNGKVRGVKEPSLGIEALSLVGICFWITYLKLGENGKRECKVKCFGEATTQGEISAMLAEISDFFKYDF